MTEVQQPVTAATRRSVLLGAGALGAGAIVAACGSGTPPPQASSSSTNAGGSATTTTTSAPPKPLKASDVPVGGGTVLDAQDTVVTQPKAGDFKAFSATCTHQGCTVGDVTGGTINCPCHGSQYSIVDGSVVRGPATEPLPKKALTVANDTLTIS
jgi:Rieske Fe-S protein